MFEKFFKKQEEQKKEPIIGELTPEQKKAKEADFSPEEQEIVDKIDERISGSKEFLAGLGRIARNDIFRYNTEAMEEIYKPIRLDKKIGYDEIDPSAYELAGRGLRARNIIKKIITAGLAGSKYAMEGKAGLKDTRRVKEEHKNVGYRLSENELLELAEQLGLDPNEISPYDYTKKYGEEKGEKTLYREKSEQEANKAAGDVLENRLKDLETKNGPELTKLKEKLNDYTKGMDDVLSTLDDPAKKQKYIDKFAGEQEDMKNLIEEKQEELNRQLGEMREPLEGQQIELEKTLEDFSGVLEATVTQERQYDAEIKKYQDKINKVKKAKVFAEAMKEETDEWQEQIELLKVNQKAFKEKKDALVKRINDVKKYKTEVDKTLNRVNSIGKTRQEAREERAAKEKERVVKEKEREEEEKKKKKKATASQPLEQWDEITGFEKGRVVKRFVKRPTPYEGLDVPNPAPEQDDSGNEAEQNAVAVNIGKQAVAGSGSPDKKKVKKSSQPKKKVEAPPAVPQATGGGPAGPEKSVGAGKENKEKIKLSVKEWLNILGLSNQTEEKIKKIINDVFSINDEADANAKKMTLPQALHAYKYYLVDTQFKGDKHAVTKAEAIANRKFIKILEELT